jgi:hypothetical protein
MTTRAGVRRGRTISGILAVSVLAGCQESANTGPSSATQPSFVVVPTITTWDLVTQAGTGNQGSPVTISLGSAGSITATAVKPSPASNPNTVYGFTDPNPAERGLGLCEILPSGACSPGEIGYQPTTGSLVLAFTNLACGTTITSVTLGSLQTIPTVETAVYYTSTNGGTTWIGPTTVSGNASSLATIPLPAGTNAVKFSPGNIDYLVQSVTTSSVPCTGGCTYTQGYWKNHGGTGPQANAWPVSSLKLGTVTYTQAQLLSMFGPVKGNGLISLADQLIAAKLNVANGASDPTIGGIISSADALIGGLLVPPVGSGYLSPSSTSSLVTALDNWNSGITGPGHCN